MICLLSFFREHGARGKCALVSGEEKISLLSPVQAIPEPDIGLSACHARSGQGMKMISNRHCLAMLETQCPFEQQRCKLYGHPLRSIPILWYMCAFGPGVIAPAAAHEVIR
jgi:hypothetical protein